MFRAPFLPLSRIEAGLLYHTRRLRKGLSFQIDAESSSPSCRIRAASWLEIQMASSKFQICLISVSFDCATLGYATPRHAMLRQATPRYTRHYITSREIDCINHIGFGSYRIITHHIISHHITAQHSTAHHITLHRITSHHITPHNITSYSITSHHITSHHIISHHTLHHIIFLV